MADNLRINVERARDFDDFLRQFGCDIDFHAMTHVKDLVHLAPVGLRTVVDDAEQRRHGKQIVLDDAALLAHEMQDFRLCAARAMHHSVNVRAVMVEDFLDDGRVGSSGGEDELPNIYVPLGGRKGGF